MAGKLKKCSNAMDKSGTLCYNYLKRRVFGFFGTRQTEGRALQFLIISDSHGNVDAVRRAVARAGRVDGVLFLGDGVEDMDYADTGTSFVLGVRGNCDIGSHCDMYPEQRVIELCSKRILMCHGHRYGVKGSLEPLVYAAAEAQADIVLFGHTHTPFETRLMPQDYDVLSKPVYFFNPGALRGYGATFGILDITLRGEIMLSHGSL